MSKHCLNCQKWARDKEDGIIGVCLVWNEYRFQYEDCEKWKFGEERIPYRELNFKRIVRNKPDLENRIEAMLRDGKTKKETRETLRCSHEIIKKVVDERGIKVRRRKYIISDAELPALIEYKREQKSIRWIAIKTGYSAGAVRTALKRAGWAK